MIVVNGVFSHGSVEVLDALVKSFHVHGYVVVVVVVFIFLIIKIW